MMAERRVMVDHSTIHRRAMKMLPVLAAVCRRRKLPVGKSWRMDETHVKVGGQWKYLCRAVDEDGDTIDFSLRARRNHAAARAFFERARSPCRQTHYPADARVQDTSLRAHPDRRHRGHAHDSQGPARQHQRPRVVASEPVPLVGFLIGIGLAALPVRLAPSRHNLSTPVRSSRTRKQA
jgi:hypothetical protein